MKELNFRMGNGYLSLVVDGDLLPVIWQENYQIVKLLRLVIQKIRENIY